MGCEIPGDVLTQLAMVRNPFRGSVVGDPWTSGNDLTDVAQIHADVFKTCCDAVDSVRSNHGSAGIVIYGEAGSGKTHLIGRLRRRLTDDLAEPTLERPRQAFAYVRLDSTASALARHVRRRVADDLLRRVGQGPNQFERMVITRMMDIAEGQGHLSLWWEHFREERLDELDDLLTDLCHREGLSPDFVRILSHLVARRHRLDVCSWLRGDSLSAPALDRLAVAAPDVDDDPEISAKQCLVDIMRLAGAQMPLVLCFDQIEALQTSANDTDSLLAFGRLMTQLHDADQNLVLISCMQSSLYQQVRSTVPQFSLDRLHGHAARTLNPLDEKLAALLISFRLRSADLASIRPSGQPDIWPFNADDLSRMMGATSCTPRRLLDEAARRFDELTNRVAIRSVPAPVVSMEREWDRRLDQASQVNNEDQSVEILRSSLQHLVHVTDSAWKTRTDPGSVLDFVLEAAKNEARVGICICDDAPNRLASQLRKLCQQYPGQMNLHKLILLRDERRPISKTATVTQQHLKTLLKHDAIFHRVSPEAIVALDALRQLLADAKSGDLDFDGQTILPVTVIDWLRKNLSGSLRDLADVLTTPEAGREDWESSMVERLIEFLNESRIARVAEAATALGTTGKELAAAASNRPDLFGLLDGAEAVVFSVRTGSHCLEESTG